MLCGMQVGLHHFDVATIDWFTAAVKSGGLSRHALARGVCEREDWRNTRGGLCEAQARKTLPRLADRLGLTLPAARSISVCSPKRTDSPDRAVSGRLSALGEVTVEPVAPADRGDWRAMLDTHHPLGWAHRPGARLSYWLVSETEGRLGGLSFAAASWHQQARDAFIGWSATARVAHLSQLIDNDRFVILPGVRMAHLASHVLAKATRRVVDDWVTAYGVRPEAVYTYVAADQAGTSYRAAGWQAIGHTAGRPPGGGPVDPKAVWVKPLADGWRDTLCREPVYRLGSTPTPSVSVKADWADLEYRRASYPDGRVRERLVTMGRAWERCPGAPLPVIFPGEAEQKAAYRLLSNQRIAMTHLLEPHHEATVERARQSQAPVILALQDTTTLNYNGHRRTTGLVSLGGGGSGTKGLLAHVGLAITEARRPLGLFDLNATQRDPKEKTKEKAKEKTTAKTKEKTRAESVPESVRWHQGLARAGELAAACPDSRVVTVCDREADIWALWCDAQTHDHALLVRSDRGRQRRVVTPDGPCELWAFLAAQPVLGHKTLTLSACGGPRRRRARTARLVLRAAQVELIAPIDQDDTAPLSLLAVSVFEPRPPKGTDPLHWVLLSTEGDATVDQAQRLVHWYEARWTIEEYFRILKVGARVEDRRFDDAEDLRKCLAFDAITAWRVMDLERQARECPERPARALFSAHEIEVLYVLLHHRLVIRAPPDSPPDIRTFVIDLGRLAGFRPSRRQPLPGTEKVWQGWRIYQESVRAIAAWKTRPTDAAS